MYALERLTDSVRVQEWNALPGKLNLKPHGIAKVISPPHVGLEVDGFRVVEFEKPVAPFVPTADHVRAEAGERILGRYPLHAQLNMQARATELLLIGPTNWDEEEAAEATALQSARDWIKSVRAASNTLEAMDPVPANYATHEAWPE